MGGSAGRETQRTGIADLDRIEHALVTKRLDADLFEDCAVSLLADRYPGLSPVPGGSDYGRDADAPSGDPDVPIRFLITASRSASGVRANLIRGLDSMVKNGLKFRHLVLVNPAVLGGIQRKNLQKKAQEYGATIDDFHGRDFFVSRLRRDGHWRKQLLGLPACPIALSDVPADLAESPWRDLPVVGRAEELAWLQRAAGDVIVTAPPGAGKTRVVAACSGQMFVDPDFASADRFFDDLRFANPAVLVVDDAGQHAGLVRRLVTARRIESDQLTFRLVTVCWPDEIDQVRDVLPTAEVIALELLEREHLDQIIVAMGVTNHVARQEILDQAEGRPGWAVALADILLKTQTWNSLLDGKVLLGQVHRYLRRASVPADAVELLAMIAALGGVSHDELPDVGRALDLPKTVTSRMIDDAAHGGLVDVRPHTMSTTDRYYDVRPPILANALVAERVFGRAAPTFTLDDLFRDWPEHRLSTARAAVHSALLDADHAHSTAHRLVDAIRREGLDRPAAGELVSRYAYVNAATAEQALTWAQEETDRAAADGEAPSHSTVAIAATVAGRQHSRDAILLLLDAAHRDDRPARTTGHPLQRLESLITHHHPDLGRDHTLRAEISQAADGWISTRTTDPTAWTVYGAVITHLLSLQLHGTFLNPANQNTLHIVETIISPAEMQLIATSIWPTTCRRLQDAPDTVIRDAITAVIDWRHIALDHRKPFGGSHPAKAMAEAKRLSRGLFVDLVPLVAGRLGLSMYLKRSARGLGVRLAIPEPATDAVFFTDVERGDWIKSAGSAHRAVESALTDWPIDDPVTIIRRLVTLHEQLELAGLKWPDRISWACNALAARVSHHGTWARVALENGLVAGTVFLDVAVRRAEPGIDRVVQRYLADPAVRWRAISAVLSADNTPSLTDLVIGQLEPDDYKILEGLSLQGSLSPDCQRKLLTQASPPVRGVAALALARPIQYDEDDPSWPSPYIRAEWLSAIELLDTAAGRPYFDRHVLTKLAEHLGTHHPTTLYNLISARLDAALHRDIWTTDDLMSDGMRHLPPAAKTKLLIAYGQTDIGWLLRRNLVGDDVAWLAEVLDADLLSPRDALKARDGFGGREPSLPDMAKLLIPRGIPPIVIADLARYGTGWGEESDRASARVEEFTKYAADPDPHVAAMGQAGITMYTQERDTALRKERANRTRGRS